ncbi:hypothetical protein GCM10023195_77260 [Actinoallomurus liliacearum]|uniref:SH3 domain-containing protein n=1 Tax=Actinoallomurus liliacearum TaxID=1080073 RepID=A0ABP8TYZ5_9ACTN
MRRTLTATITAAALAFPLTAGTASAATRHHMLISGPNGASAKPSWVYDNNPNPKKSALAIAATAFNTAHDALIPLKGTSLCLQRKSTRGGNWHKLTCRMTDRYGDVRFVLQSAPHSGWYYRIHHYSSKYFYAATSRTIHPVY